MYRALALTEEESLLAGVQKMTASGKKFEVKTFTDPLLFLENFLSLHSETVILDIDLLDEQVIRLIHIIRLISKSTPVILILSKEKMPICLTVFSLGIVSYLIKPLSAEALYDYISSTLKLKNCQ